MVAFIPGAAEHFFWGLEGWVLFEKGQVPGGCGTLLCRLCAAQFRGLCSLCGGDVPSGTLVCLGSLVSDDLGDAVTFGDDVFAASPVPSSCSAVHVPTTAQPTLLPRSNTFLLSLCHVFPST